MKSILRNFRNFSLISNPLCFKANFCSFSKFESQFSTATSNSIAPFTRFNTLFKRNFHTNFFNLAAEAKKESKNTKKTEEDDDDEDDVTKDGKKDEKKEKDWKKFDEKDGEEYADEEWEKEYNVFDDPISEHFAMAIVQSFLLLGLCYYTYKVFKVVRNQKESTKFKKAPGAIIMIQPMRGRGEPLLVYKFQVGDVFYEGKKLHYRFLPVFEKKLKINAKQLVNGKKVWVYYDENNPNKNILIRSKKIRIADTLAFAALAGLSVVVGGYTGRRIVFGMMKTFAK